MLVSLINTGLYNVIHEQIYTIKYRILSLNLRYYVRLVWLCILNGCFGSVVRGCPWVVSEDVPGEMCHLCTIHAGGVLKYMQRLGWHLAKNIYYLQLWLVVMFKASMLPSFVNGKFYFKFLCSFASY